MSNYNIALRKLGVSEYQTLRNSTGWGSIDDQTVAKALANDLFSVCVLQGEEVIGIGRVVGDGAIYYYIQDVIVLPAHRSKGVGTLIMDNIEVFLSENAGKNAFIGLMAAAGVKDFYKNYGYLERPAEGPGMFKVVQNS